jgi:hypothetical protein
MQGDAGNQHKRRTNLGDILRGAEGVEPDVDIQAMIKREARTLEDSVVATFLAEQVKGGRQALENNTIAVLPKVPKAGHRSMSAEREWTAEGKGQVATSEMQPRAAGGEPRTCQKH